VSKADSRQYNLWEGDYVLSLKENHPEVYRKVEELFPEKELGEPEYTEITNCNRTGIRLCYNYGGIEVSS